MALFCPGISVIWGQNGHQKAKYGHPSSLQPVKMCTFCPQTVLALFQPIRCGSDRISFKILGEDPKMPAKTAFFCPEISVIWGQNGHQKAKCGNPSSLQAVKMCIFCPQRVLARLQPIWCGFKPVFIGQAQISAKVPVLG